MRAGVGGLRLFAESDKAPEENAQEKDKISDDFAPKNNKLS
jgi:hypothetical protein